MTDKNKTVFISYRHNASWPLARLVFERLTEKGYIVFLDTESLGSGKLSEKIFKCIAESTHFLLILTPGTLERCSDPNDWVRNEIEYAIRLERNIVPIMAQGFNFKDYMSLLTGKLAELPDYRGLELNQAYFDAGVQKLVEQFLQHPVHSPASSLSAVSQQFGEHLKESLRNLDNSASPDSLYHIWKEFWYPEDEAEKYEWLYSEADTLEKLKEIYDNLLWELRIEKGFLGSYEARLKAIYRVFEKMNVDEPDWIIAIKDELEQIEYGRENEFDNYWDKNYGD